MAEISIVAKILKSFDTIHKDPTGAGLTEANRLGGLAIEAIRDGMGSAKWEEYMSNFASSPRQLDRLCGRDAFKDTDYGDECLAYVVGNSTCTIETSKAGDRGTLNFVKTDALFLLDKWD